MRVLALCSYPVEAAATRFRLSQFIRPLYQRGIELTIKPFLNTEQFKELYKPKGLMRKGATMIQPVLRRFIDAFSAGGYDVVVIQREAMLFGPGITEWIAKTVGKIPIVLDLDDATYVHYISPTYGRLGSALKFFGKTDNLIRRANIVICGNRHIAEYAEQKGAQTVVMPTVVDLDKFCPSQNHKTDGVTLGWIGTHSTFPFLESIFPVLEKLARKHEFGLRVVGTGQSLVDVNGIGVENLEWNIDREVDDFRSIDIGLYPIVPQGAANSEWIKGKSGFKAIQYMAVGVPFVMSPVGICSELGEPGRTHFNAQTAEDWYSSLDALISDEQLRMAMGNEGRKHALANYGLNKMADQFAAVLRSVQTK